MDTRCEAVAVFPTALAPSTATAGIASRSMSSSLSRTRRRYPVRLSELRVPLRAERRYDFGTRQTTLSGHIGLQIRRLRECYSGQSEATVLGAKAMPKGLSRPPGTV